MAKARKVERLAVILPNGTESEIDDALVRKYKLTSGGTTPFSRNPTSMVTRAIEQKRGAKAWTPEEDEYLLSHWDTTTKEVLENRLLVTTAALTKRYKLLLAEQKAMEKKAKRSSRKKKPIKVASKSPKKSKSKNK